MKKCLKRRNGLTLFEILCICVVVALVVVLINKESSSQKPSKKATTTTIDDKEFIHSVWGSASFTPPVEEVKTNGAVLSETANTNKEKEELNNGTVTTVTMVTVANKGQRERELKEQIKKSKKVKQ